MKEKPAFPKLPKDFFSRLLAEDIGAGDITSDRLIPRLWSASAHLVARQNGVVSGLPLLNLILQPKANNVHLKFFAHDGEHVKAGKALCHLQGPARLILSRERLMLNLLGRMSGIATLTRKFTDAVKGTKANILDTRKTTPGLRALEKYAVACGGGRNHRFGLWDMGMIKDNHIALARREAPRLTLKDMVVKVSGKDGKAVVLEIDSLKDFDEAMKSGARIILLDNFSTADLKKAVLLWKKSKRSSKPLLEASGGIHLGNVSKVAATGVHRISIGAITHSAPNFDIALDFLV